MKKIVQINVVCNGSTGRIMCDIAKTANNKGFKTYCFYGRGIPKGNFHCIKIGNKFSVLFHVFLARLGFNGRGSYFATKKMVRQLKKIQPDVIQLHNIHGYYINLKVLFKYLRNDYNGKIVWTLHDCWAFTGHCSHFTVAKCNKWKKQCGKCPQLNVYPKTILDTSKYEYKFKKKYFSGLKNVTIVTPSKWLSDLVKKSFLKDYDIQVIYNGIDETIFHKHKDTNFYNKYPDLKNKKIILGVASNWENNKGLSYFLQLNNIISDEYKIVLIGLTKDLISKLPEKILGVEKTDSASELVEFYSVSHVLYNPSLEETFSLVTAEAQACQLPVIVFDSSAPKELVTTNDYVVRNVLTKDIVKITEEVYQKINKISSKEKAECQFTLEQMTNKYIKLYD